MHLLEGYTVYSVSISIVSGSSCSNQETDAELIILGNCNKCMHLSDKAN